MAELEQSHDDIAPDLDRLRGQIDEVDRTILERLNERARLVKQVGELKKPGGAPVYVASRERDLISALKERNTGPFPDAGIAHVFREIISATRSLEQVVRVSFLGPLGTFSHQAAIRQFGALVELAPASSIREVFELTERGDVHYGVVPVENTTEGAVTECFDALVETDLAICGELLLEVSQNLLSKSASMDALKRVASYPQPLAQCRNWIHANLPGVDWIETPSTAAAAKMAMDDAELGAIGSEIAAEAYGLNILSRGIEDRRGNATRFVVIGREHPAASGDDLTSAVFTVRKDESGALHRLLEPFARHGLNVSAIQSRPMKGKPWEYLFFVDVEGHVSSDAVTRALDETSEVAHSHKILGSFPRARRMRGAGSPTAHDRREG